MGFNPRAVSMGDTYYNAESGLHSLLCLLQFVRFGD